MKDIEYTATSCRSCRFYKIEGHRGGTCELISALVKGEWKACSKAQHPFSKKKWNDIDQQVVHLEKTLSLSCADGSSESQFVNAHQVKYRKYES